MSYEKEWEVGRRIADVLGWEAAGQGAWKINLRGPNEEHLTLSERRVKYDPHYRIEGVFPIEGYEVEITCSAQKSPERIAKEIQSRLLPKYRNLMVGAKRDAEQKIVRQTLKEDTYAYFLRETGLDPHGSARLELRAAALYGSGASLFLECTARPTLTLEAVPAPLMVKIHQMLLAELGPR